MERVIEVIYDLMLSISNSHVNSKFIKLNNPVYPHFVLYLMCLCAILSTGVCR